MRGPVINIKVDGQGLVSGFHIRQQVCISTDTIFQKGKSKSYARLLTNSCLRKALQLDVSNWHAPQAITQHRVGVERPRGIKHTGPVYTHDERSIKVTDCLETHKQCEAVK